MCRKLVAQSLDINFCVLLFASGLCITLTCVPAMAVEISCIKLAKWRADLCTAPELTKSLDYNLRLAGDSLDHV